MSKSFRGLPAAEVLYDERGAVIGVATGDMGVGKDGKPGPNYQPGMELHAKYTFFAEGCRGQLGRQLLAKYRLDAGRDPQVYGIGLKELWQVQPEKHQSGLVIHTAGWPLDSQHLRRLLPLSHGRQPGVHRLRGRPGLYQSLSESL